MIHTDGRPTIANARASASTFTLLGGPCDGWKIAQDGPVFMHTEMTLDGSEAIHHYEQIADTTTMMLTGSVIR